MKKTNSKNPVANFLNCNKLLHLVPKAKILILVAILSMSMEVFASHFRYGHLTWAPISGNAVSFTLTDAFRRNGYVGTAFDGLPAVGDIITETIGATSIDFGDGSSATGTLQFLVTSIDVSNNWIQGVALEPGSTTKTTIDHTYPSPTPPGGGLWQAEIFSSARTSVEVNNPGGSYRVSTYLETASGNSSPVSSLPAIVNLPSSATATFLVPGADTDPTSLLVWRLASASEAGIGFAQPTGLTIDGSTGVVSWNTLVNATVGSLYSCQVIIEERDGITDLLKSQVAVDFLIYITNCPSVNATPTFDSPSPTCGSTLNAYVNQNISFTVQASDLDLGEFVTLNSGGLPTGAVMTNSLPASGNPVSSTFNWTPGLGDAGNHIVTFSATDACGAQSLCSYTINVIPCPPTSCSITATPCNSIFTGGIPTNIYLGYGPQCATLSASVSSGTISGYSWSGSFLSSTSSPNPVFSPTSAGNYTISVTLTLTNGCTATCSITFCVKDIRVPGSNNKKVYLCHAPPGNPANAQILSISVNAVSAHIGNHSFDGLGKCGQTCSAAKLAHNSYELSELNSSVSIMVYPNPFTNEFVFHFDNNENGNCNLKIFDLDGRIIQTIKEISPDRDVYLGKDLSAGIYYLEIVQGDFRKTVKLFKTN